MTIEQWIALLAALGGGALLREILNGGWKWVTGRQRVERDTVRSLSEDLDSESAYRRRVTEHAHHLRYLMIQKGISPDELPPFPRRTEDRLLEVE